MLKEIDINFSISEDKNITMIRAANESGKTTLLSALQWGLFGEEALPGKGKEYRISPLDSLNNGINKVPISVEIVFEVDTSSKKEKFRIIRNTTEVLNNGDFDRGSSSVSLLKIKPTGEERLSNPEANIRRFLPLELREIFFTDGDRALSFIEGKKGDQMKRVKGSIKSLLGLNVVQDALDHVGKVASALNIKIRRNTGGQFDLDIVSNDISDLEELIPNLKNDHDKLVEHIKNLEDLETKADKQLVEALKKGNKQELIDQKTRIEKNWDIALNDVKEAAKAHSNLFKSKMLAKSLLSENFKKAELLLEKLKEERSIPSQTIPVLEKYLDEKECICGESLHPEDPKGAQRRKNIKNLIKESSEADEIKKKLSELYYGSKELLMEEDNDSWLEAYKSVFQRKKSAEARLDNLGKEQREIEAKIEKIPDIDINQIKKTRDEYNKQLRGKRTDQVRLQTKIEQKEKELNDLKGKRKTLLEKNDKGRQVLSELEVANDLELVLKNALDTMKTREVKKVSFEMNRLFLEMIGSDSSQRSVIKQTEISEDFQIVVFGEHDYPLDPSEDLNGASRRALTLSFILALTKICEVEAPNVIDTPLGMMSGFVKRSVLYNASKESSQLILLLTHSEIKDCEDIIDEKGGEVLTFTNPAHYPAILVNEPNVDNSRIIVCDCNHNKSCHLCERSDHVEYFG
ncbi:MAG: hypothetical protein WD604_07880 [Balneolaceae bacterium]